MPANNRDAASLWDMVQAIRFVQEFTVGASYEAYLESALVRSAVERQLEILGEAARRVSHEFQQAHPDVDWRNIIGLRNIIAHRYDQVEQERVWTVVTSVLPPLLVQLEPLLPPLPKSEED